MLPLETGVTRAGNKWRKATVILETDERYHKKAAVFGTGDMADSLLLLPPGVEVALQVDVESREFNGRWYTDLWCWKLETTGNGAPLPLRNY